MREGGTGPSPGLGRAWLELSSSNIGAGMGHMASAPVPSGWGSPGHPWVHLDEAPRT